MNSGDDDNLREQLESAAGMAAADDPIEGTPDPIGDEPPAGAPDVADVDPAAAPATPAELAPFDIPQNWPAFARANIEALAKDANLRPHAEAWAKYHGENEKYLGHLRNNHGAILQQYEPLRQLLEPHIPVWQRNGQSPPQVIGQLLQWASDLQQNPADSFVRLAQTLGVDLQKLTADQPYVDPAVAAINAKLEQRERQERMQAQQAQMQAQWQQQHYVNEQIRQFEQTTNADGSPKFPHLERLAGKMTQAIMGGFVRSQDPQQALAMAYEFAARNDDELAKVVKAEQDRKSAAERAAAALKAKGASTQGKVSGKGGSAAPPKRDLRDELYATLEASAE